MTTLEIINLTPHLVNVTAGPHKGTYASRGLARVLTLPLGPILGLPKPRKGVRYIVSVLVAERDPKRSDLLVPGEQVRDAEGRIVGCRSLIDPVNASPALAMLRALEESNAISAEGLRRGWRDGLVPEYRP